LGGKVELGLTSARATRTAPASVARFNLARASANPSSSTRVVAASPVTFAPTSWSK
jgi:hypothetical protein